MNEVMNDKPIQIQGRVYSESRTYASCKLAPSKKGFKTLLGLAEEASAVREAVAKWSEGHPLGPRLLGMESSEVVVFLMGLTLKFIQEQRQSQSSDKSLVTQNEIAQAADLQKLKPIARAADEEALNEEIKDLTVLDMDDDLLETFATFPTK